MRRFTKHLPLPPLYERRGRGAAVLVILLTSSSVAPAGHEEGVLEETLRASLARDAVYRAPSSDDLRQIEALFLAMVSGDYHDSTLRAQFREFGFRLVETKDAAGRELHIAHELEDRCEGRGVYAVRPDAAVSLVVQAPHGFFDRHTRQLCTQTFLEADVFAAAWNTSHRSQVDVAHQPRHCFQAFTSAVSEARRGVTVLQLHGFDPANRRSEEGRSASVIVSNGTRLPHLETRRVAHALQMAFPDYRVCIFPWSVQELGATTNVQAARLRTSPDDEFVSLEFSQLSRQQLRTDADQFAKFAKALTAAVRKKSNE